MFVDSFKSSYFAFSAILYYMWLIITREYIQLILEGVLDVTEGITMCFTEDENDRPFLCLVYE